MKASFVKSFWWPVKCAFVLVFVCSMMKEYDRIGQDDNPCPLTILPIIHAIFLTSCASFSYSHRVVERTEALEKLR